MSQFNNLHTKDKKCNCLDSFGLIKVMKGAQHPMKTVEDAVQNIPIASVFSKLDAKSEFL